MHPRLSGVCLRCPIVAPSSSRMQEAQMSKPITRSIIERARTLIADENHWCRATLARDARGRQVDPTDATAHQRCAFGALVAAAFELIGDIKQAHDLAGVAARDIRCTSSL